MCDETYSKHCSITYKQVGQNDTLVHCYNPLVRDCVDQEEGEEAGDCREYQVQNVPSCMLISSDTLFPGDRVHDTLRGDEPGQVRGGHGV